MFYTGKVLETELRNICPKNFTPVIPPGIAPRIIHSSVIICATANSTVRAVLCSTIAKYNVAVRQLLYDMDRASRSLENICRNMAPKPLRNEKLEATKSKFCLLLSPQRKPHYEEDASQRVQKGKLSCLENQHRNVKR